LKSHPLNHQPLASITSAPLGMMLHHIDLVHVIILLKRIRRFSKPFQPKLFFFYTSLTLHFNLTLSILSVNQTNISQLARVKREESQRRKMSFKFLFTSTCTSPSSFLCIRGFRHTRALCFGWSCFLRDQKLMKASFQAFCFQKSGGRSWSTLACSMTW